MKQRKFYIFAICCLSLLCFLPEAAWAKKKKAAENAYTFEFDSLYMEGVCSRLTGNDSLALSYFDSCRKINPESASVYYELHNLLVTGDSARKQLSMEYIQKSAELEPDNYVYGASLGRLYFALGQYDKAIEVYKDLTKRFSDRDDFLYDLAVLYNRNGDYKKSNATLDKLVARVGWTKELLYFKARNYAALEDSKSVVKIMDEYLVKNPLDYSMWVFKGDLELEAGNLESALASYNRSMEISPDNGVAIMSLCHYYSVVGDSQAFDTYLNKIFASKDIDFESKMRYYRSAVSYWSSIAKTQEEVQKKVGETVLSMVEADKQDSRPRLMYATFLSSVGRTDECVEQLRTAIYLDARCMDCWTMLLKIAVDKNDEQLAASVLSDAVDAIPESPVFHFYKGTLSFYKQEYDSARVTLQLADSLRLANLNNPDPSTKLDSANVLMMYNMLAETYVIQGKSDSTLLYMRKAIDFAPDDLVSLNNYAYYMALENRDLDEIAEMSFRTVKEDPLNPTFLDTYAYILMKQGKYDLAYFYISQAIEYDKSEPKNAEIIEHLGDIEFFRGHIENAVKAWKLAEDFGGKDPILSEKIRTEKYVE